MNRKALSLLEIVVATLILAVTALGLMNVFLSSKRLLLHSRSRMSGGELGKYFLEPLPMGVRQDLWGNTCVSGNTSDCPSSPQIINNTSYSANYSTSDIAGTNLRKVVVNISWNEIQP